MLLQKAIGLFVIVFLVSSAVPAESATESLFLRVADQKDGCVYYCLPVLPEGSFSIEFLHSYDRVPYWDQYQVEGEGRLVHRRSGGRSLLNGQGFFYPGFRLVPGGSWEIDGIDEMKESVFFIMGTKGDADHRLKLSGRTVELSERIASGQIVRVSVERDCQKGEE